MKRNLFDLLKLKNSKKTKNENGIKAVVDEYGILEFPQRNIWVFNAGNTFTGNPKWLFVYINKYRPDIRAFWLCSDSETVDYINSLGYKAYLFNSKEGIEISVDAGVYVTEQCKESIPEQFKDCVYLNLFHGVGCKSIERKVNDGFLFKRIMKKYIVNNDFYLNNMLFLVTSPLMEEHFKEQVGISDDMVVKAGYPRCVYQKYYEKFQSFDHDILKLKGRDENTRIVVYAPTYRDNPNFNFVNTLLPDMDALEDKLKSNNQLLVFKLHPLMQNDDGFKSICEKYADSPYFLFWNNDNDIYEIIDRIDTAIIDYSSIFYDFLAGGVKHFIRYFADYGSTDLRDNVFDYKEMTVGEICESFHDLLNALDKRSNEEDDKERQRIYDLFWQYSSKDTMENIIDAALNFTIKKDKHPNFYSFDVFDTLISRKGLHPNSIFVWVKEQMAKSDLGFERHFINQYVDIRRRCEANVRELNNKTTYVRGNELKEISFDSIFVRMADLFSLTEEQVCFLKEKELEAEYNDCIAIPEAISYAESLIDKGEDVVLISDMYLPRAYIKKMIGKFSNKLANVPMYVSCEYGVQKASSLLYQEVYKDIEFYEYGEWIHHGDNKISDVKMPQTLGIAAIKQNPPVFNKYENKIIDTLGTYDAYLVAANMARFRTRNKNSTDYFSYAYVSLCLVTYTLWLINDAQKRGINTLYFISRDGYHLKRIADVAINKLGLNVKAKYIYGSRKAWRTPSFINEFDESFFLPFGNLASATSFEGLLEALLVSKEQFVEFFPLSKNMNLEGIITKEQCDAIINMVKCSDEYRDYYLGVAAKERVLVDKYLKQEVNLDEKFAFVDYWGRGYTQTCLARLLRNIKKEEIDVPYYYVRSIYPTQEHDVRYNCTCKNHSMLFAEALFSNIDYKSICKYTELPSGRVEPIIEKEECDLQLLNSMKTMLCDFTEDFLNLQLIDKISTLRDLLDYSLQYFNTNQTDPIIVNNLATLEYSVTMYTGKREYAPPLSKEDVDLITNKEVPLSHITNSMQMSLARSGTEIQEYHKELTINQAAAKEKIKRELIKAEKDDVKNSVYKRYSYNFDKDKDLYQQEYDEAAAMPIEDRVVIINVYKKPKSEFASIIKLYKDMGYTVDIIKLRGNYSDDNLQKIATAKYIYLSDVSGWFSKIKYRSETKLINLMPEPFPLSGLSQTIIPEYSEEKVQRIRRIHNVVYSLIPCPSERIGKVVRKQLVRQENKERVCALGSPLTDLYFDKKRKAKIRKKLAKIIPENDKKLIVYLPESAKKSRSIYDYLDLQILKEKCSGKYNLLVVTDDPNDVISAYAEKMSDFAYNGSKVLTQREAMAIANVIVGDCTATLLEGVLVNKPMFFTKPYVAKQNGTALFTEEEINIVPIVATAEELALRIKNIKKYKFNKIEKFRSKYFAGCDGNCAANIHNYIEEHPKLNAHL